MVQWKWAQAWAALGTVPLYNKYQAMCSAAAAHSAPDMWAMFDNAMFCTENWTRFEEAYYEDSIIDYK